MIRDAESLRKMASGQRVVMGGRRLFPNSSALFQELLLTSTAWRTVNDLLHSKTFLDELQSELRANVRFQTTHVVTRSEGAIGRLLHRGRTFIQDRQLSTASLRHLLLVIVLRFILNVLRRLTALKSLISRRVPVELLCDYSIATQGYVREIHRDSDAREIVVLIYLNSTSTDAGGHLVLHKLKNGRNERARPDDDDCEVLTEVTPRQGTLVAFRNTDRAYHSVSLLTSPTAERHFIYGGYTRLHGRASGIKSRERLPTDWSLYT